MAPKKSQYRSPSSHGRYSKERRTAPGRGGGRRGAGRGTTLPRPLTSRATGSDGRERPRRTRKGEDGTSFEYDDEQDGAEDLRKYDDGANYDDEGPAPEDSDFEDEEVDEDEAFDSADEDRYGDVMEAIAERKKAKQGRNRQNLSKDRKGGPGDSDSGGEEEDDDDEEDDVEGGMTLMDMLNANEAAAAARGEKGTVGGDKTGEGPTPRGSETVTATTASGANSTDLDPEGSEEEDGSDDGESSGQDDGDSADEEDKDEEEDGDEDEDDEDDEDERHARLLGFVSSLGDEEAAAEQRAADRRAMQLMKEGEFHSTACDPLTGSGASGPGELTMKGLMGSLEDTKGFAAVKQQVKALASKGTAPSAPTSKVVEQRAEREATYSSRQEDMGKWVAPVQANRRAETLDFRPKEKVTISKGSLTHSLTATTDMEKEVQALLTAGGISEKDVTKRETAELEAKAYTMEEVRERQAELAKMRALMFYEERKRHHMNKIKSKVYRKIKKHQREKEANEALEANGKLEEVAAKRRAEERMSLRHKNTSKWVKHALRAKGGAGKDDRRAISEQLRMGQELLNKMDHAGGDESMSDDDESSAEQGDDEGGSGRAGRRKAALSDADREALQAIGTAGDGDSGDEAPAGRKGKGSSLLKMAFMQKAMDKQRKQAQEEASMLLRELEDADAQDDPEEGGTESSRKTGPWSSGPAGGIDERDEEGSSKASRAAEKAAREHVAKALPKGSIQSSAVSMDARIRSSVKTPISVDLGGGRETEDGGVDESGERGLGDPQALDGRDASPVESQAKGHRKTGQDLDDALDKSGQKVSEKRKGTSGAVAGNANGVGGGGDDMDEAGGDGGDNPWLAPTPRKSKVRRAASQSHGDKGAEVLIDVQRAATTALSVLSGPSGATDGEEGDTTEKSPGEGGGPGPKGTKARRGAAESNGDGGGGGGGKDRQKEDARKHHEATSAGKKRKGKGEDVGDVENGGGSRVGGRSVREGESRPKGKKSGQGRGDAAVENGEPEASEASEGRKAKQKKRKIREGGSSEVRSTPADPSGLGSNRPGKASKGGTPGGGGGLSGLSNEELVRRAFASPDFEAEFKAKKEEEVDAEVSKDREKLPKVVAGWGSWAGEGAPRPRGPTKRRREAEKAQAKKEKERKQARRDDRLPKVIINEKRQRRSSKYMVTEVPYPFTSREQYERSLRQPIGGEWNTLQSVKSMTRRPVVVSRGAVIEPIKLDKTKGANAAESAGPGKGKKHQRAGGKRAASRGPGK